MIRPLSVDPLIDQLVFKSQGAAYLVTEAVTSACPRRALPSPLHPMSHTQVMLASQRSKLMISLYLLFAGFAMCEFELLYTTSLVFWLLPSAGVSTECEVVVKIWPLLYTGCPSCQ